jgi:hypothetical protein
MYLSFYTEDCMTHNYVCYWRLREVFVLEESWCLLRSYEDYVFFGGGGGIMDIIPT